MNAREWRKGYSVLTLTRKDLNNLGFTREQVEGLTEGEMQLPCTLLEMSLAGDEYWDAVKTYAAKVLRKKEQSNGLACVDIPGSIAL